MPSLLVPLNIILNIRIVNFFDCLQQFLFFLGFPCLSHRFIYFLNEDVVHLSLQTKKFLF